MGVYTDYVNSYKDLNTAYNNSINWDAYVDTGGRESGSSDLLDAWNALPESTRKMYEDNKGSYPSGKALWGAEHYFGSGWNASGTGGQREGRVLPRTGTSGILTWNQEQWGYDHWSNNGKNEPRVLPGAKFSIDQNKNIYLANPDAVGAGLKENYNNIVKVFQESKGGNYKGLMEGLQASLTPEAFNLLQSSGDLDTISSYYVANKVPEIGRAHV